MPLYRGGVENFILTVSFYTCHAKYFSKALPSEKKNTVAAHMANYDYNSNSPGSLGGAAIWRLPLAQGAILEARDRVPHQAPGAWSLLLPLPMSLPLSLSLSL